MAAATKTQTAPSVDRAKQDRQESIKRFLHTVFARKIVVFGAIGTLFFVLVAVFAPLIARYDPTVMMSMPLAKPSAEHWFGTDAYGRDLYARLVYGTRVSLLTGVLSVLMATLIGTFLGMLAAYCGGVVDTVMMRACDAFNAIPQVAVSMALLAVFGGGMLNMAIILCIGGIPPTIRMMRASAMSIMGSDYITAAKLSGQNRLKIMYQHVFPNSISPILVMATQSVGMTILMESGLSFLGIGIKVPTASWGSIINEARTSIMIAPTYALYPCACLALLIVSLNLLGDGVRDALDPNLRGEV